MCFNLLIFFLNLIGYKFNYWQVCIFRYKNSDGNKKSQQSDYVRNRFKFLSGLSTSLIIKFFIIAYLLILTSSVPLSSFSVLSPETLRHPGFVLVLFSRKKIIPPLDLEITLPKKLRVSIKKNL